MGPGPQVARLDGARVTCERCAAPQPIDWQAGQLCTACGGAVRREVRCAWCARLTPAARFCRGCGAETVDEARYGAARMLRGGGVDRFALARRLAELDDETIAHLEGLYAAQRAVVARRVDEVRLCEESLVGGGHAERLEDELIARLPLDDAELARLGGGPQGPFARAPERLREVMTASPIEETRGLAALARIRRGDGGGRDRGGGDGRDGRDADDDGEIARAATRALMSPRPELAREAALALAHWRTRAWHDRIDWRRVVEVVGDAPGPWAAVARARAGKPPEPALTEGLAAAEPALRVACALALGDVDHLTAALDADDDPALRALVVPVLARRAAPVVARLLADGDDATREAALMWLARPAPPALAPALLLAIERGGRRARGLAIGRLAPMLDEAQARRVLAVGVAARDGDLLAGLVRARPLPAAAELIRAVLAAGVPIASLAHALAGAADDGVIDAALAAELAERDTDPTTRHVLLGVAEHALGREPDPELARAVTRVALGPHPAALRNDACWVLTRVSKRHPDVFGHVATAFAELAELAERLAAVLADDAGLRNVGYFDWLADVLRALPAGLPATPALLDAMIGVAAGDYWLYLRTSAAQALGRLAAGTPDAARVADALDRIRATDPVYDLVYHLEASAARLRAAPPAPAP